MDQVALFRNARQGLTMLEARHWYQLAQLDSDTKAVAQVCEWYTSLVQSLVPTYTGMSPSDLVPFLRLQAELLVLVFEGSLLVGTAQASLIRPAGRCEVVMSNVVIESSRRDRGYGATMMYRLEHMVSARWLLPRSFRLCAEVFNPRNSLFFSRLGYTVYGEAFACKVTS